MVTSYLSMTSLDSCLQDDVAGVTFWFDCKANFLLVFLHSVVCISLKIMLNYSLSTLQHLVLTTCVWIKATSHSAVPRNTSSQALLKRRFLFLLFHNSFAVYGAEGRNGKEVEICCIYIKIEKRIWKQLHSYIEQCWNFWILLPEQKLFKLCLNIVLFWTSLWKWNLSWQTDFKSSIKTLILA